MIDKPIVSIGPYERGDTKAGSRPRSAKTALTFAILEHNAAIVPTKINTTENTSALLNVRFATFRNRVSECRNEYNPKIGSKN
jgi:hypothetical protein